MNDVPTDDIFFDNKCYPIIRCFWRLLDD